MKLLLIDDNRSLTTMLSSALEDLGYETASENCPENAMESIRAVNPDLIILDLTMPGKNGSEVFGEMRMDPVSAGTPVIMMAGPSASGDSITDAPGCDVISKPAKLEALHALIKKHLEMVEPRPKPSTSNNQKRKAYENTLH